MRNWRYHDTSGIGAWTRTGDAEYTTTAVRLTADQQHHGTFAGMLRIRTRLTLDASGDAWDGHSTVEVLAPDGGIVRSRESTQKATRISAGSADAAVRLAASAVAPSTLPA